MAIYKVSQELLTVPVVEVVRSELRFSGPDYEEQETPCHYLQGTLPDGRRFEIAHSQHRGTHGAMPRPVALVLWVREDGIQVSHVEYEGGVGSGYLGQSFSAGGCTLRWLPAEVQS